MIARQRGQSLLVGLHRRLPSGGSILCYHSVTTPDLPAASIVHVPLEQLRSTIQACRSGCQIVPLHALVGRHVAGRSTAGLIAVAYDDAYASLLSGAADFLVREGVPFTVFVATDAAERGARYWWDRIDDTFPRVTRNRWREFECEIGLPEAYRQGQPAKLGALRPVRQWILAEYRGRWPDALEPALLRVERDAGATTAHRSMTFDEIDRLAASPLVDVGVHTRSHAVLPLLPDSEVTHEIAGCYQVLRDRWPRAIPLLAVPFGLFDPRTLALARTAGMEASLILGNTTLGGVAPGGPIPRFVMTAGERRWRLELKTLGVREHLGGRSGRAVASPALPSATT